MKHKHSRCHNHQRTEQKLNASGQNVIYICPMHSQIRQANPGQCPICGMALEPEMISVHEEANPEYADMKRRFWIALILTIPIVLLEMSSYFSVMKFNGVFSNWTQCVLSTPIVLWCGKPFFERALQSIKTHHLNMFTLIAMGIGIAWIYSVIAILFPRVFPIAFRHDEAIPIYFEAAAMITMLVLLGQVLELKARAATGGAIRSLLKLTPEKAHRVLLDGTVEDINLAQININDLLQVRPGEKVPIDGEVIEGHSDVDESMITGESIPVIKKEGSHVIGGTLNQNGSFVLKALFVGKETMLARIIQMVHEAQRSKAPIQQLADTVSGWFVPIVILIAFLSFIVWTVFGPKPAFSYGLISAVSVLIIACPCALGLATPMSIMVSIGKGAQHGVLIKNAESLEQMEKVNLLVVDKTGTLTEGHPELIQTMIEKGYDEDELLALAASLEKLSEHPLRTAFISAANKKKLSLFPVVDFASITGMGITGKIRQYHVAIGTLSLVQQHGHLNQAFMKQAEILLAQSATVMYMTVDNHLVALFAVSDPIKKNSLETIQQLHQENIETCMLTGDNPKTAEAVAKKLAIKQVIAEIMPTEKGHVIQQLKQQGYIVAMAGDGVNDAPALAMANIGIAMGTGTDVAIANAGITLLHGDLHGIIKARKLSQATMRNIRQNLFFAFFYNALGIPLAAGLLYPLTGLLLSPMIAAAAMALSSVSVVLNALRLNRVTLYTQ
ncbi:MAG: copper-translocating P-type ATPase [Legionella sp.]|uniref:copper-transporting P-type ATPase n=1 Tax=Legionella sp. TaxID=459 RepID=UPI0039E6DB8A